MNQPVGDLMWQEENVEKRLIFFLTELLKKNKVNEKNSEWWKRNTDTGEEYLQPWSVSAKDQTVSFTTGLFLLSGQC